MEVGESGGGERVEVGESGGGGEWRWGRVEVGESGGGREWRWGRVEVGESGGGGRVEVKDQPRCVQYYWYSVFLWASYTYRTQPPPPSLQESGLL